MLYLPILCKAFINNPLESNLEKSSSLSCGKNWHKLCTLMLKLSTTSEYYKHNLKKLYS